MLLFNGAWLGAWAFGEFSVLRQLLDGDFANAGTVAFLAFWLIAWTVGGALILRAWLSNLVGREVVEVGGGSLKLCNKLGPFSRKREFDLQHVGNVLLPTGTELERAPAIEPPAHVRHPPSSLGKRPGRRKCGHQSKALNLPLVTCRQRARAHSPSVPAVQRKRWRAPLPLTSV